MQHTFDTLKIATGRRPSAISSVKRIEKDDWERVRQAAQSLVRHGEPGAALGMPISSGADVILRRIRDTTDVRGIFPNTPLGKDAVLVLLRNDPFWASATFTLGRRANVELPDSTAPGPRRWVLGCDHVPEGFVRLDQGRVLPATAFRAPQELSSGPSSMPSKDIRAIGFPGQLHQGQHYPAWINWACGVTTLVSLLFLAVALLLTTAYSQQDGTNPPVRTGVTNGGHP